MNVTRSVDVAVTLQSRLELFPLQVKAETGQFIVGRPAVGSYVALSGGALAAAELLSGGRTIGETKATLAGEASGQEIRLRPLLETLLAAGLVKAVDDAPLREPLAPRRYHLTALRHRHVAWAFSGPAAAAYVTLVGVGMTVLLAHPGYLPRPSDAVAAANPTLSLVLLWSVSMIAMAAHELAHLMAATFLGMQASFALSNRLFFAVAQTDLTDLWLVDRRERYLAYAAGMVNDVILACAAVTALWLGDQHLLPLSGVLYRTLRLAVLVLAVGLLWQFNFYLRTDVYYLIANFTGCHNLSGDAASYLKAKLMRLLTGRAPEPLAGVPASERRMVRVFAALMVVGTAGAAALGAACLAGLLWLLLGPPGALSGADHPAHPAFSQSQLPLLVSLGITSCWLAGAAVAKRRRRARVRYRLLSPEDL